METDTLQHLVRIEQVLMPILAVMFAAATTVVGMVVWFIRLESKVKENAREIVHLQADVIQRCDSFRELHRSDVEALHARDDSAKERNAKLDQTVSRLADTTIQLSTAVEVLTARLEIQKVET